MKVKKRSIRMTKEMTITSNNNKKVFNVVFKIFFVHAQLGSKNDSYKWLVITQNITN